MLMERENSMDGMLRMISIMVGCTEVSEMMDKILTLMHDQAMATSKKEENKALR